ncbi:CDP-alcohol phosphatidyltransferase family protein [Microbulbifer sp. CAU 1566]|uniref:CDP-alcohol phosphatidyltransferase family protein n=1 Tax=unclassified Microbulbifer TaxID=2619833 RepID=UPI00135C154E|nr:MULTISPECIES: CDP-alcohol phosphatidyltransferase family protein [unclassified Microbulbifer]MCK7598074.1 CDP-alcohol phosphatidyltransferase family protein [Microbulbifer sp. CAU 1566]
MSQASASSGHSIWRHLPNAVSLLRILLILPIVYFSLQEHNGLALCLYVVAALSDFVDGWLARRYRWQSKFGMLADPVADRVFILSMIPLLWHLGSINPVYGALLAFRCALQLSVVPVIVLWLKRSFGIRAKWLQLSATIITFSVLGMGFAEQASYLWPPVSTGTEIIFERTFGALTVIGVLLEILVLIRFLPRYLHVLQKRKNTFE